MKQQDVLLVDLRLRRRSRQHLTSLLPLAYQTGRITRIAAIAAGIRDAAPQVLLFLFDFPQRAGLEALANTKRSFPTIAILMLTEQHSEELAIWAFKAGARDFLFSPFNSDELAQRIALLSAFQHQGERRRERQRMELPFTQTIPLDARLNDTHLTGKRTLAALSYIAAHIHQKLTLQQVANHCNLSGFAFSHSFREEHGISFQEYIGRCRIRRAQQLLRQPELSVTDAALSAGFSDLSHFSRKFKQLIGSSPSNWRQSPAASDHRLRCQAES